MKSADSKPFLFILASFAIVFALSFLGHHFTVLGIQFKNINIISDLMPPPAEDSVYTSAPPVMINDSVVPVPDYRTSDAIIGYEQGGTLHAFVRSLKELAQGKRRKVRIAYFGDSMIEGDLMTQDVRTLLQDYFGGNGVGFVPITSVVAGFRQSVQHSFSENWTDHHFLNSSVSKEGIFLSGHSFRPSFGSYTYYSGVNRSHLRNLEECYILYGNTDSTSTYEVNDSTFHFEFRNPFNKQLVLRNQKTISATFSGQDNLIYGFSFESPYGIFLDNLAFRGISGIEIQKLNPDMLDAINTSHPYDLIILQYGPNLLFKPDLVDFRWYEKPMKNAVITLKNHFPGASILIVGAADKGARYEGEVYTQKGVLPLVEVQHRVAVETGTNFWNLYHAMGGKNTMVRWADMNPPLANIDFTHLTHKGSAVIAKILYNKLMQVYDPEAASRAQIQPIVRYVAVSRGL